MFDNRPVTSGFAEIPGVRIYYEMAGEGEPLIMLHGGFLDRRMWEGQFQFFAQRYRVMRYDMRCAGKSEPFPTTEPYMHYQDLYHLLQVLQLQNVTLMGLSNGARVAVDFALAYPALVKRLVPVSPGMSGYENWDGWVREGGAQIMRALANKDVEGAIEAWSKLWVDGPYRTPEQVDAGVRARCKEMVAQFLPQSRLAPNVKDPELPAARRLSELHVPLLVILGEKDAPDIFSISRLIQEQVEDTLVETIAGVGHTLVMEKPSEFNELVARMLHVSDDIQPYH